MVKALHALIIPFVVYKFGSVKVYEFVLARYDIAIPITSRIKL